MLKNLSKYMPWLVFLFIAIGLYVLYPIIKGLFDAGKAAASTVVDAVTYTSDDGKDAQLDVKKTLSRSPAELSRVTEVLYDLMKGLVNQSAAIAQYLKNYNDGDLEYIANAFGRRRYFLAGRGALLGDVLNLEGWLKEELKEPQKIELRKQFSKSAIKFI